MMDSYEMRMPDPREAGLLAGNGPSGTIDGVSVGGNAEWLSGIVTSGGAMRIEAQSLADWVWTSQRAAAGLTQDPNIAPDVARCVRESATCAGLVNEINGFTFETTIKRGVSNGWKDGTTTMDIAPTGDGRYAVKHADIIIDPNTFASNPWGTNMTIAIVHELGHVSFAAFAGRYMTNEGKLSESDAERYSIYVENLARWETRAIYPSLKYRDKYR
jgi:hypothetical protein